MGLKCVIHSRMNGVIGIHKPIFLRNLVGTERVFYFITNL